MARDFPAYGYRDEDSLKYKVIAAFLLPLAWAEMPSNDPLQSAKNLLLEDFFHLFITVISQ